MIVLSVIAILATILLLSARNTMPNQDIVKFKKAYNKPFSVFAEITNSDKHFLDGDLGVKNDGTLLDGTHSDGMAYLCNVIADNLNIKDVIL